MNFCLSFKYPPFLYFAHTQSFIFSSSFFYTCWSHWAEFISALPILSLSCLFFHSLKDPVPLSFKNDTLLKKTCINFWRKYTGALDSILCCSLELDFNLRMPRRITIFSTTYVLFLRALMLNRLALNVENGERAPLSCQYLLTINNTHGVFSLVDHHDIVIDHPNLFVAMLCSRSCKHGLN